MREIAKFSSFQSVSKEAITEAIRLACELFISYNPKLTPKPSET